MLFLTPRSYLFSSRLIHHNSSSTHSKAKNKRFFSLLPCCTYSISYDRNIPTTNKAPYTTTIKERSNILQSTVRTNLARIDSLLAKRKKSKKYRKNPRIGRKRTANQPARHRRHTHDTHNAPHRSHDGIMSQWSFVFGIG